jgi:hypothetical protein
MSPQIQFKAGQPQKFIATKAFSLGAIGVNVPAGAEIEYDGNQVIYGGYPPVGMPSLRGALRLGWIVPADDYDPRAAETRPQSAGMTIRDAQGGNPMEPKSRTPITTVDAEEQEVSNVKAHSAETTARNATNYRKDSHHPDVEGASSEGIPVRRLKTKAVSATNLEKTSPGQAISEAQSVKIDAGQGRTRDEMLAGMDEDEREAYLAQLGAHKAAYVDEPVIVGRVAKMSGTTEKEGVKIATSVGGGTSTADLGGTGEAGKQQLSTAESEGIRFTNTNGPKKGVRVVDKKPSQPQTPADDDMCRKIAKSVCPDFPDNYVFSDPIRKKIARLQADYDDRPDVIRAVAAAETDAEVKRRLVAEFPQAFE